MVGKRPDTPSFNHSAVYLGPGGALDRKLFTVGPWAPPHPGPPGKKLSGFFLREGLRPGRIQQPRTDPGEEAAPIGRKTGE